MRTFTTASLALVALAAVAVATRGGSGMRPLPTDCDATTVSVAQAAYLRGLSNADARTLISASVTPYDVCGVSDATLRRIVTKARTPKPTFPGEYLVWRNLSLRDESGSIDPNGLMNARAHIDLMRMLRPAPPLAAGIARNTWTSIGPGNVGGRVRAMVINPVDPNIMIIGSVAGGIWRTTNGGTSWTAVDDFMANLAVSTIVMDPLDPNIIYAGTGEGYYNIDGIRGAGIFKSTNGGVTWTQLAATASSPASGQAASDYYYINRLAISFNGSTLLAATRTGIYRSTDGGSTFARATLPTSVGLGITDIDFHPTDGSKAVAATFSGTGFSSTDGGVTWTLAIGLPASGTFQRVETAYAPSDGTTIYASVDLDGGSLYKSTTGGTSYTEVFDGLADTSSNPLSGQGWYDNLLWVSPTDANFIVWGGVDNFKSTNGGVSFVKISQWFSQSLTGATSAHADQHIAVAHPGFNGASNRTVFFGNDGGIYRAADITTVGGGASPYQSGWSELNNGLAITQFYGAAGHPGTGRITGGTQDNGTLFYNPSTANASENWTEPFGGDGGFSAYDSIDGNYFYGEYIYAQVHRNSTGGASSSQYIFSGIGDAGGLNVEFIAAFIKDPNTNDRLLVPSVRLYRTNNAKAATPSWEEIKATLNLGDRISAIAVAPANSDVIYAGHNSGRLYKTTIGTSAAATVRASWATIDDNSGSNPLPNRRVTRITVDATNNNIVYVTFGGFSGDNIYKSTNGGTSWTDITGASGGAAALPEVPVRDLEIHPSNNAWIYAGTEVGIFASEDGGSTWTLPHDGPSSVSVDELFFLGSTLYAATHGRGLFKAQTLSPPTISTIANQTTTQGTAVTASFTVADSDTALTSLTLSGSSSNTTLLPNAAITFGGSSGNRTITLTPATGQHGTATVTITVSDSTNTASTSFLLTVTVPPTISSIANHSTTSGVSVTANVTIDDPDTATTSLTLSGSSSNTTLLPNSGISFGGSGASRTITVTPASGQTGSATITVTVTDGSASASTAFALTVTAVPTISGIGNQTTAQGTAVTVGFTIADADSSSSGLTLAGASSNTTLLPNNAITFAGSGGNRTITLTPASGQSGTATITITVSDGTNAASASFVLTVSASVPGVPMNVSAVAGNAQAAVSFNAPSSNGGASISGYTVTASPGGATASGTGSPITMTGLTNGTAYTFTVTATNSVGTSATSSASVAVTPATVPGSPANVSAVAGNTQATVTFTAPSSNGGSTITNYTVTASPGGAPATGSSSPITVTGLTNGTAYTFTVTATNGVGTSASSAASNSVTPQPLAPGTPINFTVSASSFSITGSWTSTGGAATTHSLEVAATAAFSSVLLTMPLGAVNGFNLDAPGVTGTFFFRVRASNNFGSSPPTGAVGVTLPGVAAPPGAPVLNNPTVAGNNVTLTWAAGPGGAPANYTLIVGSSPGSANVGVFPMGTSTSVSAGAPDGTYYVRVQATNGGGTGPLSNEVSFTIGSAPGLPPGNPRALSANVSGSTVTLIWSAPTSGGAPTSYTLHAGSAPGLSNLATVSLGLTTTFAASAVPTGTYFLRVVAVNGVGASDASNEVTVTVGVSGAVRIVP